MATAPDMLMVGERGYYREFGETWPARVVANDIIQTFGPIDALLAVTKWPGYECIVRLVRRCNSTTGGYWVSYEQFEAEEKASIAHALEALQKRAEALVHG